MNKAAWIIPLLLLGTLTACHQSEDVSVDGNRVILHPSGEPPAEIDARGNFSVAHKKIELPADQQALFVLYHDAVVAVHRDRDALKEGGKAMARQGLHLAGNQIRDALAHSSSSAQESKEVAARIQTKGEALGETGQALCREIHQLERTQSKLAEQVSAFKPYANIDASAQVHCSSKNTDSNS